MKRSEILAATPLSFGEISGDGPAQVVRGALEALVGHERFGGVGL